MQNVDELVEQLRHAGGRVTPQRIAVLNAISTNDAHPTVDDIFDEVSIKQPSLSRKTVYQIVNNLASIGAVNLVDVGTGQVRIDPTVEHVHDHFVCSNCSQVFDIPRKRKTTLSEDALAFGEIQSVDVVYRGLCHDCSSSQ